MSRIDRLVQQLKVHQQLWCVVFVALMISLTSSIASADLIGYWPFDTDFSDVSGNGYHGTAVANPLIDSDAILGAGSLSVNRPDGVEVMTSDEFYDETTGPLSATVWIKADRNPLFGGNYGIIIGKGEDSVFQFEYRTNGNVSWQIKTDTGGDERVTEGGGLFGDGQWHHIAGVYDPDSGTMASYYDGELAGTNNISGDLQINTEPIWIAKDSQNDEGWAGLIDDVALFNHALSEDEVVEIFTNGVVPPLPPVLAGNGDTYSQNFDEMGTNLSLPAGWSGVTEDGATPRAAGLGLTDGFLTVPGSDDDGVLGILNLGGNAGSFGPAPDGFVPTWSAELGGDNNLFGRDDVIVDNASDRALGVSRENNDDAGELNFEIEIVDNQMRAFVLDWDLEIWGGDPDGDFRSPEGPGMKVDVRVGGNSYDTMTETLLPGSLFDSIEDGDNDHNATLINGNAHSIRGITSGIKEVSDADGAIGNMVQLNFNSNWNGATDGDANGWFSAIDNVRLRALAPGDADANGVVDVADLLQLLGGQKFNAGVDGVTWEQGDFNADDQFNTGDLLAMLSFLSGTFPSDPYASEAGGASDAVADIIVNSETGEVTVDLAGHTVSAVIIESASEIFNGQQPEWDTTSQFPSTLPGELGNVLFTSTAAGVDELGAVISAEFLGRDKEFYLQDLDLNILIASEGGALTKGNVIVVPEPSTWMLLGLGSLAIVGAIRKRNA